LDFRFEKRTDDTERLAPEKGEKRGGGEVLRRGGLHALAARIPPGKKGEREAAGGIRRGKRKGEGRELPFEGQSNDAAILPGNTQKKKRARNCCGLNDPSG